MAAAAIVAGAVSVTPVQASPKQAPAFGTGGASVELAGQGRWRDGDRRGHWRDRDRDRRWRHSNRRHHRQHHHAAPFYFGFPFAFAPPYYPYHGYQNCFRTWDGQLICR
jgi:hypothetical protein